MGASSDPNHPNDDPNADDTNFSQDHPSQTTEPFDVPPNPLSYNRRTMIDDDTANDRSSSMRKLLIFGGALLGLLLLLVLYRACNNQSVPVVANTPLSRLPATTIGASPGALIGDILDITPETAIVVPTRIAGPAATATPTTSERFVVTGTEGSGLYLRQGPSISAEVIGALADGTVVESTGTALVNDGARNWRQVQTPVGEGWVADGFLQPTSLAAGSGAAPAPLAGTNAEPTLPSNGKYVVAGTGGLGLHLRREPSTSAEVIGALADGTVVEAASEGLVNDGTRSWRHVRTPVGEGWVANDFLTPAP